MSIQTLGRVIESSQATGTAYAVLLMIANHEGDHEGDAYCWPAIDTLAREARCSRRQVIRCVAALEEIGELTVERNAGSRGTNLYRVSVGRGSDEMSPVTSRGADVTQTVRNHKGSSRTKDPAPDGAVIHNGENLAEALLAPDSTAQYLIGRMSDRWREAIRPGALMKLGRVYGAAVVTDALRDAREDEALAFEPYPYLESICVRLQEVNA